MKKKPEKIRKILSQNIKKRREVLGLSQEKLAEAANLSVQTINTIEGCRMWVSDKTISRLAEVLKIEVFQLFVPYDAEKQAFDNTSLSVLFELRQKILSDIENLGIHIDSNFDKALKNQSRQEY